MGGGRQRTLPPRRAISPGSVQLSQPLGPFRFRVKRLGRLGVLLLIRLLLLLPLLRRPSLLLSPPPLRLRLRPLRLRLRPLLLLAGGTRARLLASHPGHGRLAVI